MTIDSRGRLTEVLEWPEPREIHVAKGPTETTQVWSVVRVSGLPSELGSLVCRGDSDHLRAAGRLLVNRDAGIVLGNF